jgi:gluconokinase
MVVIVMGVAGSGKTTIGQLLARALGWKFRDADGLHPAQNRDKMGRGIALTETDRRPWLEAVRRIVEKYLARGESAVIACSALKQSYRDLLIVDSAAVRIVYLRGPKELIERRLAQRHGHFFNPGLLTSQFETLEEPDGAIVEDISRDPAEIADSIRAKLGL